MTDLHEALATVHGDAEITRVDVSAVAVLARSEVEAQLDAAHKYPRSIARFLKEATTLATLTQEIAEACIYTLPRGGKSITGPSVRLAEIAASSYGNMHVGARVIGAEDKEVISQGVAWDLEKNLRVTIESRRRITGKSGKRYDDDMITVTGNAAASIALRNAIFRVVPRAYIDSIYAKVKEVAVGNAETLAARRERVVGLLCKMGIPLERVLARVEKAGVDDIGLEELETLIGLGTSIRSKDSTIDEAFPPVIAAVADPADLEKKLRAQAPAASPSPANPPRDAARDAKRAAREAKPEPAPAGAAAAPAQGTPTPPPAAPAERPPSVPPPAAQAPASATFVPCSTCGKQVEPWMGTATGGGGVKHRYLRDCAQAEPMPPPAREPDDGEPPPHVRTVGREPGED